MLHLRDECNWFGESTLAQELESVHKDSVLGAQSALEDSFKSLVKDVKLIETYSGLYSTKSQIGVSECFAMINQREAEVGIGLLNQPISLTCHVA